jgi:UDP-N-acetylglucosamine--N-acetylmuramyl-(pentapeptide) pyrophosphoryl-undecaprenol N-acetylglucosamine transferase
MNDKKNGPVILSAGGTGGHIFPAEALAEGLLQRGYEVALVTDKRFKQDYAQAGSLLSQLPVLQIPAGRLAGGLTGKLKGGLNIVRGLMAARRLLKKQKPQVVVGFGGYPSFPALFAATTLGIPTIIHEQNAILGRANRKLSPRVNRIALSYEPTQLLPEGHPPVVHTGNPVRGAIRALRKLPYAVPGENGSLHVLVVGGSQGASVFSDVVPAAIALLPEEVRNRLRIDQQCRAADIAKVRAAYDAMDMRADLAPFFSDMATRMASAHLVITRAGASTVAELKTAGRPAILVPLPTAMDRHQDANAQNIEDADAGWVMAQDGFTPEALAARLESFVALPESLKTAAENMHKLGEQDAVTALVELVESMMQSPAESTQEREAA